MIDIPLGKALVPVETDGCGDCIFNGDCRYTTRPPFYCDEYHRKDGKSVIFKLVDYPVINPKEGA